MPGTMPKMMVMAASTPAATMRPVVSDQVPVVETSEVDLLKVGPPAWGTQQLRYKLNGHTRLLKGKLTVEGRLHLLMMMLRTLVDALSIHTGLFHVKE